MNHSIACYKRWYVRHRLTTHLLYFGMGVLVGAWCAAIYFIGHYFG